MNKNELNFIKKIAKKADESHKIAKEALDAIKNLKYEPAEATLGPEPTTTFVKFENVQQFQEHSPKIAKLNQEVHKLCKSLGIKELRINFKQ